jgi:hypothetical protein
MNQKLAIVLFIFAFVVAIVVGFGDREDLRPAPAEFRAKFHDTLLRPKKKLDPSGHPVPAERIPASGHGSRRPASADAVVMENDPLSRESFMAKYGDGLDLTDYEGRVIRVDGSGLPTEKFEANQKISGFRPSDPAQVAVRAREVFENARRLLGIPDDAEFIQHQPATGESSSQVSFQQSDKGVPISPGGLVTILLGPDGEVRAIDSSIYPKTEVANQATLPPPQMAREILFVTQSAPVAIVRHAYETRDRGIQKVVDAQTGAVLLERDRRIH